MKKTNNKGFSLVELIIVVAIMAILIGVLAPQYIKYVEKSRVSADETLADQVLTAVQLSLADADYQENIGDGDGVAITTDPDTGITVTGEADGLVAAFEEYFGELDGKRLKSKRYSTADINITADANGFLQVTLDMPPND